MFLPWEQTNFYYSSVERLTQITLHKGIEKCHCRTTLGRRKCCRRCHVGKGGGRRGRRWRKFAKAREEEAIQAAEEGGPPRCSSRRHPRRGQLRRRRLRRRREGQGRTHRSRFRPGVPAVCHSAAAEQAPAPKQNQRGLDDDGFAEDVGQGYLIHHLRVILF